MELYVKYLIFSYLLFFLVFNHDFTRCVDFNCIAAPNTANDDV